MRVRQNLPLISKRPQEFDQSFLFVGLQFFEFFSDVLGFATVAEDGVEQGNGGAVVHEAGVQADAPERGGTDFICGVGVFGNRKILPSVLIHVFAVVLGHGLNDIVAARYSLKAKQEMDL